jgi:hypothetical protein
MSIHGQARKKIGPISNQQQTLVFFIFFGTGPWNEVTIRGLVNAIATMMTFVIICAGFDFHKRFCVQ